MNAVKSDRYEDHDYIPTGLDDAEAYFWHWFPHEVSWAELHEANAELYAKLQNLGQALVLAGRLKGTELK